MTGSLAFDDALSLHRPYLLRFARQRLRDTALVEDLVQDTLLAALQGVERFAAKASLRTWLTGILLNKIADSARREQRAPVVAAAAAEDSDDDAVDDPRAEPIEWRDPARMLENRQFIDVLRSSLDTLPPLAARAFALREIEGLSGEAVARELGLSAGQIAVLLLRARARLRERLQQHGFARAGGDAADFN